MKIRILVYCSIIILLFLLFGLWRNHSTNGEQKLPADVLQTCKEAEKYKTLFLKKYPEKDSLSNEALQSREWHDTMAWQQACDTARADTKVPEKK